MNVMMTWLLCCVLVLGVNAQTIQIVDHSSGEPLPEAAVSELFSGRVLFATSNGSVDLTPFSQSKSLQISSFGYSTRRATYEELLALPNGVFRLVKHNLHLSEILISAHKWSQTSRDIPQKIAVIPQSDVLFQQPQTAADLLGISGKVFVQKSQQGGGSPMIRGFAANRLLYSVDGIRMNTAIFRGGNIQNVINLDPFAIQTTEILFGPASVIYGSDAIGGVMNFQTLQAEFSQDSIPLVSGTAVSRYSSANSEKTGHASVQIGWEKWALRTSITAWDFGDLRQGSRGPEDYLKPTFVSQIDEKDLVLTQKSPGLKQIPSGYSQLNLMQKVRFRTSKSWEFYYAFHYSATSSYGRYDRHNRVKNSLPRYAEWNYGPQKWMMNQFRLSHFSKKALFDRLVFNAALQNFEESRISRDLNDPLRFTQAERVQAVSLNLDFHKQVNHKNTLYYGGEWIQNKVKSDGSFRNILNNLQDEGPPRYPQSTWISWGTYLNWESKFHQKVTLQSGVRYSRYSHDSQFKASFFQLPFENAQAANGNLSGSIGIIWNPEESWSLSSNLGTAFRAPNVDDIGKVFDSEPGAVTVPNPSLSPEYAYNWDISVAKVITPHVKFDLTGYYTLLTNALVRRNFQLNGQDSILYAGELSQIQAIQNAAQSRVYGFQLGIQSQLTEQISFSTDLNFQKGKEELDNGSTSPSRHAAPFFGLSRLDYSSNKIRIQLAVQFQAEQSHHDLAVEEKQKREIYALDSEGNTYAPAWHTLNLKISYPIQEFLVLTVGLENISDQRYRPYSSGISGPGRNLILALKGSF